MDPANYIVDLSFFIVFALLGTVLSMRLRQPYVVGLLVFGLIAGPSVLGLVSSKELISVFTELGAIFLLFTVGIEFSVARLIKSGFRALLITAVKMSLLFFFGYEAALYFGLGLTTAFYIGAMVSITSTALLFKILEEKKIANPILPLLFSMLIIEDVFAVAALTFLSSIGTGASYEDKVLSALASLAFLGVFYTVIRKPAAMAIFRLTSTLNQDVMILVSFSLCLVMSMVAAFLGVSPAIGAFLAGSIIATIPNSRAIEKTLRPLLLLFAALFFLSLGMSIDMQSVIDHYNAALLFISIFAIGCFGSVFILLYLTGAKPKNAVFGASAMVVLGEFSLIIASQSPIDQDFLIAVGSLGVIATAIISSLLLDRQETLYAFFDSVVPYNAKFATGSLSIYITGLIGDFSPNGKFWRTTVVCWDCIKRKLEKMAVIGALVIIARSAILFIGISQIEIMQLRGAILVFGAFPMLHYLWGILRDIAPMLDALSRTIARHKRNSNAETRILRDAGAILVLLFVAANLPDLVAYLKLPPFFDIGDEVALLFAFAFAWDIARKAGTLRAIGKRHIARAKKRRDALREKMRGMI